MEYAENCSIEWHVRLSSSFESQTEKETFRKVRLRSIVALRALPYSLIQCRGSNPCAWPALRRNLRMILPKCFRSGTQRDYGSNLMSFSCMYGGSKSPLRGFRYTPFAENCCQTRITFPELFRLISSGTPCWRRPRLRSGGHCPRDKIWARLPLESILAWPSSFD